MGIRFHLKMLKVQNAQEKINEKFKYLTVVKYLKNSIYLFNDNQYGEFEGRLSDVLRGQKTHYKRQKSMKNLPLEEIKYRLNEKIPHLTLIEYNGFSNLAVFLDENYGEFQAIFKMVYRKKTGHPERSKFNKSKHITSNEFKEKRKQTMINKYGVENAMHSEEIKNKLKKSNLAKYGAEHIASTKEFQDKKNKVIKEKYGTTSTLNLSEVQKKIKATNIKKYGCENPFANKEIQNKIKQTNLEKYGVEHVQKNKEIQEKTKKTNLKKYGYNSPTESQKIKEKIKETNLKKYGVENPIHLKEIKEKIIKTNLQKYGVNNPQQNKEIQEKTKNTNLEKYGFKTPLQSEKIKKKIKETQIKNGTINIIDGKTIREFIKDKDISITTACKIIREQNIQALKEYNKHTTFIEQIIGNILKANNIIYTKQEYLKNNNNRYFTDFSIKESNLIIECDGLYWHSEVKKNDKNYHKNKQNFYKELGYNSLFFREDEILNKAPIVESIILAKLGLISNRIYARKCQIKEIGSKKSRKFFEENHLMGRGMGKTFALIYENQIVSAIRVINKKDHIDISRFCNRLNTSVAGGLSKLLKHVIKEYNPKKIVSFVDMRYGDGSSLKKIGFQEKTNYVSFKWTDFKNTYHRMNFRNNSGYERGLCKIWDCGQKKFELNF